MLPAPTPRQALYNLSHDCSEADTRQLTSQVVSHKAEQVKQTNPNAHPGQGAARS